MPPTPISVREDKAGRSLVSEPGLCKGLRAESSVPYGVRASAPDPRDGRRRGAWTASPRCDPAARPGCRFQGSSWDPPPETADAHADAWPGRKQGRAEGLPPLFSQEDRQGDLGRQELGRCASVQLWVVAGL